MRKIRRIALCAGVAASLQGAWGQTWDTYSDTWVAVDELNREVASSDNARVPRRNNRTVGMFYYIWHGAHGAKNTPIKDITELLKADPVNPAWGAESQFHWWGKPWLGYYNNTDAFVYDKHLQMLCDAGVDFLFLDVTNAVTYDNAVYMLMAAIDRRAAKGLPWPKICYTLNSGAADVFKYLYANFYSNPDYDKYWYCHEGKPLMLVDKSQLAGCDPAAVAKFTMRHSWAWMKGAKADQWAWLEYYPQKPGWTDRNGVKEVEQISVSTGQHATSKVGKSYHGGKQPALDQYGLCTETSQGLYFDEQWRQALSVDPPLVMVTQFNEYVAQRFVVKTAGEVGNARPAGKKEIGETYFVDAYNAEFNRDIEPSTHPQIRDNYYMMLCDRVRRYKGMRDIPTPNGMKTIVPTNDMSQWSSVKPEFRDDRGDITHRNTKGFLNMAPMVNSTGRTDLEAAKVSQDGKNLYFYLRTVNPLPEMTGSTSWVQLFINSDCDYTTGWNGYDYLCMKSGNEFVIKRHNGKGYSWTEVATLSVYRTMYEMHFAVPKSVMGIIGNRDIDFKWADNIPASPDILDFIDKGDVAPNGRFNYRFKGSVATSAVEAPAGDEVGEDVKCERVGQGLIHLKWGQTAVRGISVYDPSGALQYTGRILDGEHEHQVQVSPGFKIIAVVTDRGTLHFKSK